MVTAAGSNSATATLTSAGPWVMQMVGFVPVSGPAPTVSSVSPNSGSTSGGTAVTITGTNFVAGATVSFGSAAATSVAVVNSTTITATTPAGSAGAATVTVTNSGGQSGSLASGFTYIPGPTVTSVSPSSGAVAGGTAVTITGTNFAAGATVTFGSTAATSVVVVNSTTITATTPAGSAGAATVTVTNSGGQSGSLASGFTYIGTPTVSSVSPNSGSTSGGTAVTITGTNFAAGATVTFGSAAATSVVVVNSTTITATTPAGSAGAVTVTVTNLVGSQSGSLASGYTYVVKPTVSSVSPSSGAVAGGTAVTITGTNFAAGATVTFGSAAATSVVVVNSTTITATTPAGSAGAATVTVTNSGGQSGSLANGFTYIGTPTVSSVTPNNGSTAGGTAVTITGTNFAAGATVTFGSAAATSVVVVNSTTITATTPAGSAGAVTVTVTNLVGSQSGSLASGYTYVVKPTVSSVSPSSGPVAGGTAVTITGTNFAAGATVTFGSTAATSVVVVNSTTITATTPAGSAGAATVTVTNSGGQSGSLASGFTYIGQPTVTSVSPNNGPVAGGTAVTITGTNFATGATVTFGSAAATSVVVVNSTTITAKTPAGSAGAVTVTVTNSGGLSGNLASGFTYNASVAISFAQVASATPQSSTASVSVTYPAAQTSGDMNVVVVGWNDTTATVQSVKDSAGNTYKLALGPTEGTALQQSIYYAADIVSGGNTVTVTFSAAAAFPDVRILEYRGVTAVDVTAGASGNSASASSGAATTTGANELIFGANTVATTTGAAGSGFTSRIITPDGDIAEDKVVTAAGSNSATATLTSAGPWVMQMVGFVPASSGPDNSPPTSPSNLAVTGPVVQNTQGYINTTFLTTHTTAPFDSTGGDLIVVCASSHAGVTMTPSDSFNNTWIAAAGPTNTSTGFDLRTEVWYAKSPTVGPGHTFTLNLSAAESLVISVIVVKGSNTSSPIDQISAISDDGGSQSLNVSSPSITTTNSNDLLIGFAKSSVSETFTSGTGYTPQPVASSDFLDAESEAAAMPGTYSATFTINAAATWQDVVAAVSTSAVNVNISWNPSTDNVGVTGYLLERCQGGGCTNFTQIATTTGTVYTDTGLTASTSYSYRVRATDAAGNLSNYSNILTITSPSGGGSAALATSTQVTATAEKDPSIQDGFERICRLETV